MYVCIDFILCIDVDHSPIMSTVAWFVEPSDSDDGFSRFMVYFVG